MSIIISIRLKQEHRDFFKCNDINVSEYINRLLDHNLNDLSYLKQRLDDYNNKLILLKNEISIIEDKHNELLNSLNDIDILKLKEFKNKLKNKEAKLMNCYNYFINYHKYITYSEFVGLLSLINY